MDYEYEYGRYKKKVEDQQKEIEKLREEAEGWQQVLRANDAIINGILQVAGATKENPMVLPQEVISAAIEGEYRLVSLLDVEAMAYKVYVERAGE